ncbi:hypothetical protein PR202_gb08901 [Eleusine coracana subsp. coracana]|uniref:Choline transporter-like protein n=1 Tax=Eleusine coracana subsp. coracana TaxID=191504 RepID=A0AAV5EE74_ELECO|nr:hypothetical protein PR202_gb08901 [Eleusine coracana subsp. coracana]
MPPGGGGGGWVVGAASAGAGPAAWPRRRCRDVFWLVVFLLHLLVFGAALALFGLNRFRQADRFNIGRFANQTALPWGTSVGSPEAAPAPPPPSVYRAEDPSAPASELTETYWKYYGVAGAVGAALAWAWLAAAAARKDGGKVLMRTAVHSLTAYLAVVSVLCFWGKHFFWGVALAVGAGLHFLYVMSVLDRFPFTMLVLQKAVKMIRGIRSKIGSNECLLCCIDFVFHIVETLVRFFNKYAYVQIAVNGQSFNRSARDAWELFQSTGIEALVAYDCSGAVLLMSIILGGLLTGTCTGVWVYFKQSDKAVMVGSTSMLMGMILVGLTVVVVESAVTSIYICYAEDPLLIQRWDPDFFEQISEALHQRLQYRSSRARQILNGRLDHLPHTSSI